MSRLSRRRFLAGASAAIASAPALANLASRAAAPGFLLGCQTYTFREFDLEGALKRMKELGIQHAEFYQKHLPLGATGRQLEAFQKLCADYGVSPRAWGVQRFSKDHDGNRKVFDFAKGAGLKVLTADPDPDSFDSLDKCCEEYGIAVAIHPHGPVGGGKLHRWYDADTILAAVKDHHRLIGSCMDTGHLIRSAQVGKKLDPAEQIRKMGKRNFAVHLKDHDNAKKEDVVFGKGVLDVAGVLKALKEVGFTEMVSIEYEAKPQDPTGDVRECVAIYNQAVKELG
jgi:inosose dehydratase